MDITNHLILLKKVKETLQNFSIKFSDPFVIFFSIKSIFFSFNGNTLELRQYLQYYLWILLIPDLNIIMQSKNLKMFVNYFRCTVTLQISTYTIVIRTKEGQEFVYRRDVDMLIRTLLIIVSVFFEYNLCF